MFTRLLPVPLALLALTHFAHGQSVLSHEDFESGYANWTMTGLWNPEASTDPCGQVSSSAPNSVFPSGTHAVYYGNGTACNYETGGANSGQLTRITPVSLPSTGRATVRFWTSRLAEGVSFVDVSTCQASSNGGASWTTLGQVVYRPELAANYKWHAREYDLAAFLGQTILLRFQFDSVDDLENLYLGWFLDDISVLWDASTVLCPTSLAMSCPCGGSSFNVPWACANSNRQSAELRATGSSSVSSDTLRLEASWVVSNGTVLFAQGSSKFAGSLLGDGRLCLGGSLVRLGIKIAVGGRATFPELGDPSVSAAGLLPASGGTRAYQALYRDNVNYCTSDTFNLSSTFELVWSP